MYFVPPMRGTAIVEISTKTAVAVTTKSGTKNKHFVPPRKPDIPIHTAIIYTKWNSYLGLKV